jgi:hypothetical protein
MASPISKIDNPKAFIFDMPTGIDATRNHQQFMRENEHMALAFPIPELQYYFHPVYPGEQATIFAESHNYKTGFMDFWASHAAQRMAETQAKAVIIKINTEDAIETLVTSEIARHGGGKLDDLSSGIIKDENEYIHAEVVAGSLPIVHIGESLGMDDSNAGMLYLSNIIRLIDFVRKSYFAEPVQIAAIFLDYIQSLPLDPEFRPNAHMEQTRRLQVIQDETRIRRAAKYFSCPVIMAAQSRELDKTKMSLRMPGYYDIQESTFVSQRSDRLYALALPKMSSNPGTILDIGPVSFKVNEEQLWIKCHKQKHYKNVGAAFPLLIKDNGDVTVDPEIFGKIQRMEQKS